MSNIAIRAEGLSKRYKIGVADYRHDSIRDHLTEWVKSLFIRNGHTSSDPGPLSMVGGPASPVNSPRSSVDGRSDTIWALKDVSFEVKQGDVVGIIGRNGAGKSTLLKILSRITEPTSGTCDIHGRAGSLLEVGTGFHRDLTGRENIYLNGAIIGMRKAQIDRKFDEIVDFSGVEKFIDTPVKRYSSGMYVRLAFAVATHLEPEILIVDEVLAVGDAAFQRKCLGRMGSVAKEGRTVLFVSHNMAAVEYLCSRVIAIENGQVAFSGTPKEAIDFYLHNVDGGRSACVSHSIDLRNAPGRPPGYPPLLQRLELYTDAGVPMKGSLKMGASLKAHIYFRLEQPTSVVNGALGFDSLIGQRIFHAHSSYQPGFPQGKRIGDQMFVCEIPSLTLVPGEYKIKVSLDIDHVMMDRIDDAVRLVIIESDYYGNGKVPVTGFFALKHSWSVS